MQVTKDPDYGFWGVKNYKNEKKDWSMKGQG